VDVNYLARWSGVRATRSVVFLGLFVLVGCGSKAETEIDECAPQAGTCVSVQVNDATPSVGAVDGFEVALSGAANNRGAAQLSSSASLPAAIAVLLPSSGGQVKITIGATRAGALVGLGSVQVTAIGGQHSIATLTLASACGGAACALNQLCVLNADCASQSCSSTSLTCVTAGASPSATTSTLTAPSSVAVGASITVALQAKDAAGNLITGGGATVVFTVQPGTGTASVGTTTDNGNGTYAASVTGMLAGSVVVTATLNGAAVSSQAAITVTGSPGPGPDAGTCTVGTSTIGNCTLQ
jgi:hypothetical protein